MKLYIFGSCSGTEPMENRHHTALALEIGGRFYWFDAGESCSYTAHLLGVDLLRVSDIFISHPHMDHVGGLGNLLWTIRKLSSVKGELPQFGDVTVYTPNTDTFDGILKVLRQTEGNYKCKYQTLSKKITDSTLLNDENIKVEAKHNLHLPETAEGWQSFSFRVTAENKRIVYSGDLKDISDITEYLEEGCDLLLMETGHHSAEKICRIIADKKYPVKELCFLHHGREILNDYDGTLKRARAINPNVKFANDKDILDV